MFAAERIKKIKEILLEYKYVDVNTLCTLLSCSIATVRRDLDKLEGDGFLTKAYGGAILNETESQHIVLSSESDPYHESKKNAAKLAASLVANGDIIFIGQGSTCSMFASFLKCEQRQNLTIVTNNLTAAQEFSDTSATHIIVTGGNLDICSGSYCTVGAQTISMLSSMFIDKAFFTVDGISIEYGYTVADHNYMSLLHAVMQQSTECFAIADLSKFGRRSLVRLFDICSIKSVITNAAIPLKYKDYFFNNKIKLYTSFDD